MSTPRKSTGFLGLIILGGFCVLALWVWVPKGVPAPPTTPNATSDLTANLAAGQARIAELIEVTTDRPVFQASRKPPVAPEVAPEPVAPDPTLTLVGILGDQEDRVALVRLSDNTQLYRLEIGGQLGQFQILAINDASVEVSKDGGEPELVEIGE